MRLSARLRKINNILHRDIGYFFAGTTIIYAISGLAVNHVNDWNPSFIIQREEVEVEAPIDRKEVDKAWVREVLKPLGEERAYLSHDFPTDKKVKIYLKEGSIFLNLMNGKGEYETIRRRPLFYQVNFLHLSPKRAWLVFSDFFAVGLIVIVVTGLFVLKGKRGIAGRGAVLVSAGLVVPLIFLLIA